VGRKTLFQVFDLLAEPIDFVFLEPVVALQQGDRRIGAAARQNQGNSGKQSKMYPASVPGAGYIQVRAVASWAMHPNGLVRNVSVRGKTPRQTPAANRREGYRKNQPQRTSVPRFFWEDGRSADIG
jgi:hypothetical protein